METQVERHLNLALHGLKSAQLQVNEVVSLVKEQSQQIERLMSKNKEQAQQIESLNYAPFVWKIPEFITVYGKAVSGEQEVI